MLDENISLTCDSIFLYFLECLYTMTGCLCYSSKLTGARRQALLQRCVLALLTFCQSPHESTHVNVSPAKGCQDIVLTPTTSFVVISDRVGTLPPAEGGNVRGTLLRGSTECSAAPVVYF
jgi:hypothetical protein